MFENLLWKLTRKGFYIELEAENMFPNIKGFVYPNELIMQTAIEKYCIKNGISLTYLSKENPIKILLDGEEVYTAKLEMCHGKERGYTIHCVEEKKS